MRAQNRFAFLDAARGVAILLVVLYHSLGISFGMDQLPWKGSFRDFHAASRTFLPLLPLSLGWCGVAVFFVISGFCIQLSHASAGGKGWRAFFTRRFFRIYPPYFLSIFIAVAANALAHNAAPPNGTAAQYVTHGLLIHNFFENTFFGINPSFWSIAVEAQLYALYPVLLLVASRRGWRSALVLSAAAELGTKLVMVGWPIFYGPDLAPRWLADSPFSYWFSWTLGAYLAERSRQEQAQPLPWLNPWLWAAVALVCDFFRPLLPFCFTAVSIATAGALWRLIVRAPRRVEENAHWLATHWLEFVGVVSYSIYLLHQPLLRMIPRLAAGVFHREMHPLITLVLCLAALPVIVGLAWMFYRGVEIPCNQLGKRLAMGRRGGSPALASAASPP